MHIIKISFLFGLAAQLSALAASTNNALLELNDLPFFYGREYFVLRSGRAELIVQADRADLGPAFTWLLFNAEDSAQSARKARAFNYVPGEGFARSALEVELGGFPFSALGHRTDTRWVVVEGIPVVEAVWWAGGLRVTEQIAALAMEGAFRRTILVEGAHLVSAEPVKLRLLLPPGERQRAGAVLLQQGRSARLALAVAGQAPLRVDPDMGSFEIGPLSVAPKNAVKFDTFLVVPNSPVTTADLRFRQSRLRLTISGAGPIRSARVNGSEVKLSTDGAVRLPRDFAGGTVELQTQE